MERKRKNANFINGVPELLVLKLLSTDKLYGYQLVKEIQKLNPQAFDFGEGCIYPILHNLEKDGLLESEPLEVGGRTRLYYRTTPAGVDRLSQLSTEWLSTIAGVGRLFDDTLGGMNTLLTGLGKAFSDQHAASTRTAQSATDQQQRARATAEY